LQNETRPLLPIATAARIRAHLRRRGVACGLNTARDVRSLLALALLAAACEPPGYGKGKHDVDAAPGGGDGPHASDGAVDTPAATTCDQTFRLDGHGSSASVWLTGDFVQWAGNPSAGALLLALGNDGVWTGDHQFPAGTYLYKFIVDDSQWIADPGNPNTVPDGFGGMNSVYTCTP
jgi:hypothetical protein